MQIAKISAGVQSRGAEDVILRTNSLDVAASTWYQKVVTTNLRTDRNPTNLKTLGYP